MREQGKDWVARESEHSSCNRCLCQCHGELGSWMALQSCPELKQEDQTKLNNSGLVPTLKMGHNFVKYSSFQVRETPMEGLICEPAAATYHQL